MRRFHKTVGTVILFLMILVSACAPRSQPLIAEGPPLPTASEATTEATEARLKLLKNQLPPKRPPNRQKQATELVATEDASVAQFPDFDPNNFDSNSTVINNKWMPMKPGTF